VAFGRNSEQGDIEASVSVGVMEGGNGIFAGRQVLDDEAVRAGRN